MRLHRDEDPRYDVSWEYLCLELVLALPDIVADPLTLDIEVTRQVRVQNHGISKVALLCDSLDILRDRLKSRPHRLHEEQVLFFGKFQEIFQFWGVGCGGLFAENVLACEQSRLSILIVKGVWSSDINCLDILDMDS